jgi:hypothetical protein
MLELTRLDDAHLTALSRALHEARFCFEENDPLVWQSPRVIDLHVWTLEEQQRRAEVGGRSDRWEEWLAWEGREEAYIVVRRLRANPKLLDLVADDPALLRDLLRPFVVEDADLEAMIRSARS